MSARRTKSDYPFLTSEPGPEQIDRELRNEFIVTERHGENLNVISRGRLDLPWLLRYMESLKEIIAKSGIRRELIRPNVGDKVTVGEIHGFPVGSPPWHAETILFWIKPLIHVFKSNESLLGEEDMSLILDAGIRLGAAIKESQIDAQFSDPLLSGLKRREDLRRNSTEANAKKRARASASHKKWREAASKIWSKNPNLTVRACARTVICHLGLAEKNKTVWDQIADLKPKKVGDAR